VEASLDLGADAFEVPQVELVTASGQLAGQTSFFGQAAIGPDRTVLYGTLLLLLIVSVATMPPSGMMSVMPPFQVWSSATPPTNTTTPIDDHAMRWKRVWGCEALPCLQEVFQLINDP
jgi:hypothetical protein